MKSLLILLLLISCGHHRDVRPGASGIHRVLVHHEDSVVGAQDALKQANHYCDQKDKKAAIVEEKTVYVGDVDEATYKRTKMFTRAMNTAGTNTAVHGAKKEKNYGQIGMLGGMSADSALGKGYKTEMAFRCM
jgi:hypothetical protein